MRTSVPPDQVEWPAIAVDREDKLILPTNEGLEFVPLDRIVAFSAEGNYTTIFTGRDRYVASKTLKAFEQRLLETCFLRVHRSHMINIKKVKAYKRGTKSFLVMDNNLEFEVGQSRKQAVLALIRKIFY
ncbi:MAG: LytTR family DNA-binding domain-containing protein [Bacteroidota bacterium]